MKLTVSQKKTTPISKDLIGVFFEDINYGADGGIYAEPVSYTQLTLPTKRIV